MKKFLFIFLAGIFLSFSLEAKIVTKTSTKSSTGEGTGLTREEAVNNAIIEAIGKMSGVNINSLKTSQTHAVSDNQGTNIQDSYSEQISKATKGRADTYEINSAEEVGGKWHASVTIFKTTTTKSYKAPGLSADSRRSITVFSVSPAVYSGLGSTLQQKIITDLLQSRKLMS